MLIIKAVGIPRDKDRFVEFGRVSRILFDSKGAAECYQEMISSGNNVGLKLG